MLAPSASLDRIISSVAVKLRIDLCVSHQAVLVVGVESAENQVLKFVKCFYILDAFMCMCCSAGRSLLFGFFFLILRKDGIRSLQQGLVYVELHVTIYVS